MEETKSIDLSKEEIECILNWFNCTVSDFGENCMSNEENKLFEKLYGLSEQF
jgi:hypothetical protein